MPIARTRRTVRTASVLVLASALIACERAEPPATAGKLVHAIPVVAAPGARPAHEHAGPSTPDPSAHCRCHAAKNGAGWCRQHATGFIAGVGVPSGQLYDYVDPHGHRVRPDTITCAECQRALARDGFCATCRLGYIDEQLYATAIAHALAAGRPVRTAEVTCPACRSAADSTGWCAPGAVGLIGPLAFTDAAAYERARRAREILNQAVERTATCEECAIRLMVGGTCRACATVWPNAVADIEAMDATPIS